MEKFRSVSSLLIGKLSVEVVSMLRKTLSCSVLIFEICEKNGNFLILFIVFYERSCKIILNVHRIIFLEKSLF